MIDNLVPGASAYSNTITVSVDTNGIAGYTLSAKVGDGTTYMNDRLTNSTSGTYFTNLSSNASQTLTNFQDNQWGYALGTINNNSLYSGLVYNVDKTINATTDASGTAATGFTGANDTNFTIAAKAAGSMASGDYKNVIVFTAVSNQPPRTLEDAFEAANKVKLNGHYKMQDMSSSICADADITGEASQMQAMDIRDNKLYWITKLADGHCWMTQNLDHDINHNYAYSSVNTDIPNNWNQTLVDTHAYSDELNEVDIPWWDWDDDNMEGQSNFYPESVDLGDICWTGVPTENYQDEYPYDSCSNLHYHLGNYYNWTAAVAMGNSSSIQSTTVNQSICPAGWKLPADVSVFPGYNWGDYSPINSHNLYLAPYYYVYGGAYNPFRYIQDDPYSLCSSGEGSGMSCFGDGLGVVEIGDMGYYWGSYARTIDGDYGYADYFGINYDENDEYGFSDYYAERSVGYPIRCLAR